MPLVPKKFSRRKLFLTTFPPPGRQRNFGQCTILGVQKFFRHTKIFPDIIQIFQISQNNTISHKIDRICPIFLYYKPILPDCEANIAYRFVVYYFSFADKSLHLPTTCFQGGCHPPTPPHTPPFATALMMIHLNIIY